MGGDGLTERSASRVGRTTHPSLRYPAGTGRAVALCFRYQEVARFVAGDLLAGTSVPGVSVTTHSPWPLARLMTSAKQGVVAVKPEGAFKTLFDISQAGFRWRLD